MLRLTILCIGLVIGSQASSADDRQDCIQVADPDLSIKGCSAIITAGHETAQNLAVAHSNRSSAYYKKGDLDHAIADATEAIKLDPKFIGGYVNRGVAFDTNGDYDHALADYNKALEINPADAYALGNRGLVYYQKGDLDRSLADLDKAVAGDPKQGNFEAAIPDYARAIEINPKLANAFKGRAWAYFKLGKPSQALPDADKSLELRPNDAATLDVRGRILEALGRNEEAAADYRKAVALEPALVDASRKLQNLEGKGVQPSERPPPKEGETKPLNCRNYVPSIGTTIAVPCDE